MRKSIYIKRSISFLLSAAMIVTGFFSDTGRLNVQAQTELNQTMDETQNAYESSFSSDSATNSVPVLSSVQTRKTDEEEQSELYRCSVSTGHPIALKDILIASGFLSEEDTDDYLNKLKDVSFRQDGALRRRHGISGHL